MHAWSIIWGECCQFVKSRSLFSSKWHTNVFDVGQKYKNTNGRFLNFHQTKFLPGFAAMRYSNHTCVQDLYYVGILIHSYMYVQPVYILFKFGHMLHNRYPLSWNITHVRVPYYYRLCLLLSEPIKYEHLINTCISYPFSISYLISIFSLNFPLCNF